MSKALEWPHHFTKRRGFGSIKTSLTPPLRIEVHVPSQEIEQSCNCVLLTCEQDLHDRIISLRGEFWPNRNKLKTPLHFTYVPVRSQEGVSGYICLCVRDIGFPSFYDFGIVPTVWYLTRTVIGF